MLTITLKGRADLVTLRRSLTHAQYWFDMVGKALSEHPEDPIAFVVPSVIVPEYNVVLYPRPKDFEPEFVSITAIEAFEFDPRLLEGRPTTV